MAENLEATPKWYSDAQNYWNRVDSTINGMLGGFGHLDPIDAASSSRFIKEWIDKGLIKLDWACDCGAGIGRVSKSFLLRHFKNVDLVEQEPKFLEQAKVDFDKIPELKDRINYIPLGLQNFTPHPHKYSLIWCQWVLSHLTDQDLVDFLIRCKSAAPAIGIKENVASFKTEYDTEDMSKTRPDSLWKSLFEKAGLLVIKESKQDSFPDSLFQVKMYLLIPHPRS